MEDGRAGEGADDGVASGASGAVGGTPADGEAGVVQKRKPGRPKGSRTGANKLAAPAPVAKAKAKPVVKEESSDEESAVLDAVCEACGSGIDEEHLLICDGCNSARHTYCARPRLDEVPQGDWHCEVCVLQAHVVGLVGEHVGLSAPVRVELSRLTHGVSELWRFKVLLACTSSQLLAHVREFTENLDRTVLKPLIDQSAGDHREREKVERQREDEEKERQREEDKRLKGEEKELKEVGAVLESLLRQVAKAAAKAAARDDKENAKEQARLEREREREKAREEREAAKRAKEEARIEADVKRCLDRLLSKVTSPHMRSH